MAFDDLSREQLIELKQGMLEKILDGCVSWGDLADADEIVSDEMARQEYGDVEFSPDDFLCSAGL